MKITRARDLIHRVTRSVRAKDSVGAKSDGEEQEAGADDDVDEKGRGCLSWRGYYCTLRSSSTLSLCTTRKRGRATQLFLLLLL